MTKIPLTPSEEDGVRALRELGILDTAPELAFDEIAELAAMVCDTPSAMVSLLDESRLWFKARHNFALPELPREISFCARVAREGGGVFEVEDAAADPRFSSNPLVAGGPRIRFYAGVPLTL